MNRSFSASLLLGLAVLLLAGCITLAPEVTTRYQLDAEAGASLGPTNALRVAVQRFDGSAPYKREQIVVSPKSNVVDTYTSARWANDPCNMLSEALITYLAPRCAYVTSTPRIYKDDVQVIVTVYIDALDQVQRGKQWFALFRVRYEIVADASRRVLESDWFERTLPLPSGKPEAYVQAQRDAANELFALIAARLSTLRL